MANVIDITPEGRFYDKMERDQFDPADLAGFSGKFAVVGAILKSQGAVLRDLNGSRSLGGYLGSLALVTLLFSAAYGAILGMHQPGLQTLFAAAKLPIVILGSALLCTPTFYVFNSILGSKLSYPQTLAAVLFLAACAALVLLAFAPIAWFFTVSTRGVDFLRLLHLGVFVIAAGYGFRALNAGRRYLNYVDSTQTPIHAGFLALWFLILLFVAVQMAWYFRPLILPGPFHTGERGLFLELLSLRASYP